MAGKATTVRFIDGPLHGEVRAIEGNPRMLKVMTPPRIPPADPDGLAVGGYLHYERQADRQTYRLVPADPSADDALIVGISSF